MNQYNLVVCDLHFKNIFVNLHLFKSILNKFKSKIRVRVFGEMNVDRIEGDELDHDQYRFRTRS